MKYNSTETTIEAVSDKNSKTDKKNSSNKAFTILGIIACIILAPILILNIILIIQGFTVDSKSFIRRIFLIGLGIFIGNCFNSGFRRIIFHINIASLNIFFLIV